MKKLIVLTVLTLMGIALSCEKDSVLGVENEALELRETESALHSSIGLRPFEACYILMKDKGLNADGVEARPYPGQPLARYYLRGEASFLGKLSPSESFEEHYPPDYSKAMKPAYDLVVRGVLASADGESSIYYAGTCAYRSETKMIGHYKFYKGTGKMEGVSGHIDVDGFVGKEGWNVWVYAEGKISFTVEKEPQARNDIE